jgi:hypothetical protein
MHNLLVSKNKLENMYSSGSSMFEIAAKLGCSINKVVYWMDKYKIKRRSRSDATYLKRNPDGDPFRIKKIISPEDNFLHGLGLGIYWGEGEKISKGKVRVANSDPRLILSFRKFLIKSYQVKVSRIHYYIICFNDSDPNEVAEYWSKILKTSKDKFGKIVQVPPQGKGTYRRKSRYGVCILEISNIKLKQVLMGELKELRTIAWIA